MYKLNYTYELSIDIETERREEQQNRWKYDDQSLPCRGDWDFSFVYIGVIIVNMQQRGTENEHFEVTGMTFLKSRWNEKIARFKSFNLITWA